MNETMTTDSKGRNLPVWIINELASGKIDLKGATELMDLRERAFPATAQPKAKGKRNSK